MDIAIGVTIIVLLVVVIIKLFTMKGSSSGEVTAEKIDSLAKMTASSFSELRRDERENSENLRASVNAALNNVGDKMDRISEKTADSQINVVKSLSEMSEKLDAAGRRQGETVREAIEKMQVSNEKKLDDMRKTVDEKLTETLGNRLDSSFKSVSEQLSNVYKSLGEMKELSGGVTALNRMFSNVKTRGTWAEVQLEGILDKIIPNMYVKNYRSDSTRDVVEFAAVIPDSDGKRNTYLPIDSKFPMEDYLRLSDAADAGDTEGVKSARKALEARVLSEAKDVKKYINPPATTPFAILYLATDALYAEVISSKENIADRLHDEYGILLAGPSIITALLSSLAMGFRTVALNQKANEVMDLLAAAKSQYDKFGIALDKARRKIDEAGSSLDDAQHRNSIIVKKLKNVEEIAPEEASGILTDGI